MKFTGWIFISFSSLCVQCCQTLGWLPLLALLLSVADAVSLKTSLPLQSKLVALMLAVFSPASYWDNFHSCATTALADCQEGATDLWDKLKKESRNLNFRGSLFELCGGGNGAPRSANARGLALVLTTLPTILTWLAF